MDGTIFIYLEQIIDSLNTLVSLAVVTLSVFVIFKLINFLIKFIRKVKNRRYNDLRTKNYKSSE